MVNGDDNNICVFNIPSCLIVTRQKIGTSFTQAFFDDILSKDIEEGKHFVTLSYYIEIDNDNVRFKNIQSLNSLDESADTSYELNRFLNNSNFDKDVIILIRNPWKRFVSAFIQDYIKPFIVPHNSRILEMLGQIFLKDSNLEWWVENRNKVVDFVDDQDGKRNHPTKLLELFEIIIEQLLIGYMSGNYKVLSRHNGSYHSIVDSILKINKNIDKVKIFDIDEVDLNDVYRKYKNIKIEKENVSRDISSLVENVFDKNKNFKRKIEKELESETNAYNNLKQQR